MLIHMMHTVMCGAYTQNAFQSGSELERVNRPAHSSQWQHPKPQVSRGLPLLTSLQNLGYHVSDIWFVILCYKNPDMCSSSIVSARLSDTESIATL